MVDKNSNRTSTILTFDTKCTEGKETLRSAARTLLRRLAGSSDKKPRKNEVEGKDNDQPIFSDTRANLLNDRFAKLSDDELENPGDDGSDVHD